MDRRDHKSPRSSPETIPPGTWRQWRERWLDPVWHMAITLLFPGAWVPPIWSLLASRRAPIRRLARRPGRATPGRPA